MPDCGFVWTDLYRYLILGAAAVFVVAVTAVIVVFIVWFSAAVRRPYVDASLKVLA